MAAQTQDIAPERLRAAEFGYVPALDGLRGVAIIVVMAYHAFPATLTGGFLGVELFFVLSGFLITGLLLKEWDRYSGIHLSAFYMRRAIRLLPALVALLVGVTLVDSLFFDGKTILRDDAFALAYVMNWARAFGWVESSFLSHTWSLSIEEQFYLLWPAVLAVLCRRCDSRELAYRLMVAAALFALYRTLATLTSFSAIRLYNGLDTRADGLLLGSALAAAFNAGWISTPSGQTVQRIRRLLPLTIAGLAVLGLLADWRHPSTYILWLPLTVVLSTSLIGCVYLSPAESPYRRLLESRWLVGAGRISYGLYLWHYPVYRMLGQLGWKPIEIATVGTGLTFVVAVLSWRLIEKPILSLKGRYSPAAARRAVPNANTVSA